MPFDLAEGPYAKETSLPWESSDPFSAAPTFLDPLATPAFTTPTGTDLPLPVVLPPEPDALASPSSPSPSVDAAAKAAAAAVAGAVPADVIWTHQDPAGPLGARMDAAIERALLEQWSPAGAPTFSTTSAVADLRALLAASVFAIDDASTVPPVPVGDAQLKLLMPSTVTPPPGTAVLVMARAASSFKEPTVANMADAILRGWEALADRVVRLGGPKQRNGKWFTDGASAAVQIGAPTGEAGALAWPGAVVVVAGIAAVCYLGTNAFDVWDRHLGREADSARLTNLIGAATTIIAAHADADRKSGVSTPLTAAEAKALDALNTMVSGYAAATIAREARPVGGGGILGGTAAAATQGAASGLMIAAVLVGAYLLLKKG